MIFKSIFLKIVVIFSSKIDLSRHFFGKISVNPFPVAFSQFLNQQFFFFAKINLYLLYGALFSLTSSGMFPKFRAILQIQIILFFYCLSTIYLLYGAPP
jgi:hypothetical protein